MLECPDRRRFVILPASLPFIVSGMKEGWAPTPMAPDGRRGGAVHCRVLEARPIIAAQGRVSPFIVVAIPSLAPRSTETFAHAPGSETECPSSV